MGRRTRKPPAPAGPDPDRPAQPGNRPFAEIAASLKAAIAKPAASTPPSRPAAADDRKAPVAPEAPPGPSESEEDSEEDLLRQALGDVTPLRPPRGGRVPPARRPSGPTVPHYDEEAEALAKLAAMVDGVEPLGHEFGDEHTEWIAEDVDPGLLKRLVAGEFAWQDHIDLHGMTREQAKQAIFRFLAGSRIANYRCVLIVHGRGHHSEDQIPVLKAALQRWLRRGALKDWVFAYATARPVDGGPGAMYVMLRRPGSGGTPPSRGTRR